MAKKPAAKKAGAKTVKKKAAKRKSKYKFILVNKRNGICSIQLNRPDFLNAMNVEMAEEISRALVEVETGLDEEIIAALFVATWSRTPTEEELKVCGEIVTEAMERKEGLGDVLWALINAKEFIYVR